MCNKAATSTTLSPFPQLAEQEIANSLLVIDGLFNEYRLAELKGTCCELLKAAAVGNYADDLNKHEKTSLFRFYKWTVKLLEAAYLLNEARKTSKINP